MAKYRWGFEIEGVFTECFPRVDDETALEYSKESNQQFYRAKLNSNLDFRFEYDDIINAGYNAVHIVVLQSYNETTSAYEEVWRGKFTLTDCTVNVDTRTITVLPETLDRYTKLLDHLGDEYNMVKLEPTIHDVVLGIRPCLQIYCRNDNKLTNIIDKSYWEQDSEQIYDHLKVTYHFDRIGNYVSVYVKAQFEGFGAVSELIAGGEIPSWSELFTMTGTAIDTSDGIEKPVILRGNMVRQSDEAGRLYILDSTETIRYGILDFEVAGFAPTIYSLDAAEDINGQWSQTYGRLLFNTDADSIYWAGETIQLYDIPTEDIVEANKNYNKVGSVPLSAVNCVGSTAAQDTATEWGQNLLDRYFVRYTESPYYYMAAGISLWKYASIWLRTNENLFYYQSYANIRDSYTLEGVIKRLLERADNTIIMDNDSSIFLYSDDFSSVYNMLPTSFFLMITPRSNVITSYYDTPAQNAPITLQIVFTMLRQLFKVYWYIDDDNRIHFEHIYYFENGLSYNEENTVLIDLDSVRHTRTLNSKAYGQNTYKYDKQDMPSQIIYSFDDNQTLPFDGLPMKAIDQYVSNGLKEDNVISQFDTDVDYILATPSEVSKDGFVLFACPRLGGEVVYSTAYYLNIRIKDDDGIETTYNIQNGLCSISYLQTELLRYNLPCEHWMINNYEDTAKTTGNFKLQTIEFADFVMNDIITDITNCIKKIRTQQGDGSIKTLSINLNSFSSKADLLFNFIGRKYYLKGTALNGSMIITINGEQVTIVVSGNSFTYGYTEPLTELSFANTDVVSVDFADADKLDNLTSADEMFMGCEELVAVDFGNKTFGAVTSATDMFAGAVQLQTLICPNTNSWKADLDFSDCQQLTVESLNELIVNFLYDYDSGTHTITPNTAMWNNLAADVQTDLLNKAQAKGWQIAIPAQYALSGTSGGSTVYVTINGTPIEIDVVGGTWQYDYNTPISSISFENDTDVVDVDFSLSDGLAAVTSLNDAFKGCVGLTTVDFSNCDLSNLVSATDCFAGCTALYELIVPQGTWQPDLDLSASVMPKSEMLNVINGLYVYTSGTHTITFNSTIWDAMSVADQQIVFNAADAKGWTTNAVAVVYVVRGTSSAATETFNIQFIQDGSMTPDAAETITCAVDGNGDWDFSYIGKKIYYFSAQGTTITSIDCSDADDFNEILTCAYMFTGCAITSADLSNAIFGKVTTLGSRYNGMFERCTNLTTVNLHNATFASLTSATSMFYKCSALTNIDLHSAIFGNVTQTGTLLFENDGDNMFGDCSSLVNLDLTSATWASLQQARGMFYRCASLTAIDFGTNTMSGLTDVRHMFAGCVAVTNINMQSVTFANTNYCINMFADCRSLATLNLSAAIFGLVADTSTMFNNTIKLTNLSMPNATFASVTNATGMFATANTYASQDTTAAISLPSATFANVANITTFVRNKRQMTSLVLSSATFDKVATTTNAFQYANLLADLDVPQNSTAILPTSTAANAPMVLSSSPLTYTSMLKVANWLSDLTGQSAHTCTFKASAWNALSSAEQTTIDGILSAKNWTRAIA